jgi:cytoskeletal protein CcmA (bactofilin family)
MFTKKQSSASATEEERRMPLGEEDRRMPLTAPQGSPQPIQRALPARSEAWTVDSNGDGVVVIGKGTRLIGEISDCRLIDVQGVVEGKLMANSVIIREGGGFKGSMQTDHAEIHGVMEGSAVINDLLDIRSTGTVAADLAYGRLSVEAGGQMTGNILARVSIESGSRPASPPGEAGSNGKTQHYGGE